MPNVRIDCFHEHLDPVSPESAIVAVDVIRATTTAITAVTCGKRIFPAGSMEAAVRLAADLDRPVLAGELGGVKPYGFDVQNSPVAMTCLPDDGRPVILLSTTGTRLIAEAVRHGTTYAACLRNAAAQARYLLAIGQDVLILGADSRGEFREEDQLCAARIAAALIERGYEARDRATFEVLDRFAAAPAEVILTGRSARYLRDTGQQEDLDYVLDHIDDLDEVFTVRQGEVRALTSSSPAATVPPGE